MVGGFLAQMWDLFHQFRSGLKTTAVSFKERDAVEFPSFAVCDSRAYSQLSFWTANAKRYNATTLSLEGKVSLNIQISDAYYNNNLTNDWNNYTTELLPTIYNGYCMLYEFQRKYPVTAMACKYKFITRIYFTLMASAIFQCLRCLQTYHMMSSCLKEAQS